uniref:VWF/SSPO/Zonadhesin-like cysteine-rich domain-containing protein n=1 Tax=Acrobeloides nanus TaxID=290746 RepID=A0A914DFU7_9BILA
TVQDARDSCQSIQDAENATGIFQVCAPLGQAVLEHLFDDCVYDVCLTPIDRCPTLAAFVEQCQSEIPFADVGDWRSALHCPPYYCPVDSTYSSCASRCQPTCAYSNGTVDNGCIDTCTEGCMCNPGYVVDTSSAKFKCIQIEDCGCTDGDGNTYGGIKLSLFLVLTGRSQVPGKSFGCKGNRKAPHSSEV